MELNIDKNTLRFDIRITGKADRSKLVGFYHPSLSSDIEFYKGEWDLLEPIFNEFLESGDILYIAYTIGMDEPYSRSKKLVHETQSPYIDLYETHIMIEKENG